MNQFCPNQTVQASEPDSRVTSNIPNIFFDVSAALAAKEGSQGLRVAAGVSNPWKAISLDLVPR